MEIKIYANYGCLAAEKRTIYTYGNPAESAVTYDILTVKIPNGYSAFENNSGELIVESPWGRNYTVNELLAGSKKNPAFVAIDQHMKRHHDILEVVG